MNVRLNADGYWHDCDESGTGPCSHANTAKENDVQREFEATFRSAENRPDADRHPIYGWPI